MWIRSTVSGMLINLDYVRDIMVGLQGNRYAVNACFNVDEYRTIQEYDTREEAEEYLDGLTTLFFNRDFPGEIKKQQLMELLLKGNNNDT